MLKVEDSFFELLVFVEQLVLFLPHNTHHFLLIFLHLLLTLQFEFQLFNLYVRLSELLLVGEPFFLFLLPLSYQGLVLDFLFGENGFHFLQMADVIGQQILFDLLAEVLRWLTIGLLFVHLQLLFKLPNLLLVFHLFLRSLYQKVTVLEFKRLLLVNCFGRWCFLTDDLVHLLIFLHDLIIQFFLFLLRLDMLLLNKYESSSIGYLSFWCILYDRILLFFSIVQVAIISLHVWRFWETVDKVHVRSFHGVVNVGC